VNRRLGGRQSWSEGFGQEKNLSPTGIFGAQFITYLLIHIQKSNRVTTINRYITPFFQIIMRSHLQTTSPFNILHTCPLSPHPHYAPMRTKTLAKATLIISQTTGRAECRGTTSTSATQEGFEP
jgi:hypothetical protein